MRVAIESDQPSGASGPLPPCFTAGDFLVPADHAALLAWTLANRDRFAPAAIHDGAADRSDSSVRIALNLRDLGPLEARLRECLLGALSDIVGAIGGKLPVAPSLELELTAYGDGAFYAPHLDIMTGPSRKAVGQNPGEDRLVSAVYYFHRQPKAFSGGDLRLYRWGVDPDQATASDRHDLPPADNSLVAFPSWARHEVRAVACPSGRFEDYRFALNCWYCGKLSA